jgi:DNA polymerase-3 subunit delta'
MHPLVGHGEVRAALSRARDRATLPAALLVMGPRGIGKQRLALWIAQRVLCAEPREGEPCGECRNCRRVLRLEHPDLHWFFPVVRPKGVSPDKLGQALEEARHERLGEIRESAVRSSHSEEPAAIYLAAAQELRRKAASRPAESGEQFFIIGDAETLVPQESSPEAANALLKLLEEPPSDTRFILTSSEPGRLLDTIRSRTVPLHLSPLPVEEVSRFLTERGADPEAAEKAARLSGGSIGMALGFLPEEDGEPGPLDGLRRRAFEILRAGLSSNPGDGYAMALGFKVSGARGLVPLLDFLDIWIRDLAATASGATEEVMNQDALGYLRDAVERLPLHPAAVSEAVATVERARREARGNVNPQLIVAGLVARLQQVLLASPLVGQSS